MKKLCLIYLLSVLLSVAFCEDTDTVIIKINERDSLFINASQNFNIDVHVLKSITFTERSLNYDWFDEALDIPTAIKGYNSSIGFCQVKLKTAYWIEVQLSDSTSEFYPGEECRNILPLSKSPREIIMKLQNDSLNVLYAAAYLKIIQSFWERSGHPIGNRPDILGTLYSTGLYLPSGKIRKPNSNPKTNLFGKKVKTSISIFKD